MNVAVILIPTLVLVSGLVAFVGNLVGRGIGRRRLALGGLRPRHTAQLITVLTGMFIASVTLAVVLLVSEDARQALFHLQEVRQQIAQQEAQLRALQVRDILYLRDQEVLRTVVDGREPTAVVRNRVQAFFDLAVRSAQERGVAPGPDGVVVRMSPSGLTVDDVAQDIVERHQPMVVRMIATANTVRGEPLEATVIGFPNTLVFTAGEAIVTRRLDGRSDRAGIEAGLLDLSAEVAATAKQRGVISPAFALASSPPDVRLDPAVLLATLERVQASRAPVEVQGAVTSDTYTIGPVVVTFR
ncbi:MAG TPA: DUF3084 domain-containing protein [bacterium]|nr:DUF3084 domain-containing protein [bacterium]